LYGVKIWTDLFFRFVTIHAFDRQTEGWMDARTDRIFIARLRLHCMQRRKKISWEEFTTPKHTVLKEHSEKEMQ